MTRAPPRRQAILVWGANPSASAPHQHAQWLPESPGRVIVVDPMRTDTARQADLHLQPYPGSDAALAYAIAHVIWRDGLLRCGVCASTAAWAGTRSNRCWPAALRSGARRYRGPAEQIEQAAQWYGPGPSLLWIGQGFQRQPRGGNAVRAVGQLARSAATSGGPAPACSTSTAPTAAGWTTTTSPRRAPRPLARADQPHGPAVLARGPGRTKALVCWNINIAASNPEQRGCARRSQREDLFTVAVDLFATDTTDLADVVLPAASFLECDDIVASYFNLSLSAQVAATAPMGESLPNSEIFRRLAAAMGMTSRRCSNRTPT